MIVNPADQPAGACSEPRRQARAPSSGSWRHRAAQIWTVQTSAALCLWAAVFDRFGSVRAAAERSAISGQRLTAPVGARWASSLTGRMDAAEIGQDLAGGMYRKGPRLQAADPVYWDTA